MKTNTEKNLQVALFEDGFNMKEVLSTLINSRKCEDKDDAFYCVNIEDVLLKHYKWKKLLPRVKPFYAIKCNTDPLVLQLMMNLDMGFDCASKVEIKMMLDYGVKPQQIVFANPCKQLSHIKYAVQHGVDLMTFDNETELRKFKQYAPNARLILRILTDDSKSLCQLGIKYGAPIGQCRYLLTVAKELNLNVIGVSFHVGSGCFDATAFKTAVESARMVFDWASNIGFNFTLLDVGGGFPGSASKDICFEEVCSVLNDTLERCFPYSSDVRVIAEPGRFYVSTAFTLATNIIAKREMTCKQNDDQNGVANTTDVVQNNDGLGYMYYINDGVYGSFNCLIFDHATIEPCVLHECHNEEKFLSSIWGPSCDSIDCVMKNVQLPICNVGDWLYFEEMGAYTLAAASGFNGFDPPSCFYFISRRARQAMEQLLPGVSLVGTKLKIPVEEQCVAFKTHCLIASA